MKRLVCVVEGHGDVQAIPNLCSRIRVLLDASDWFVDPDPVRQPRSLLVDERVKSPHRPCREESAHRAVSLALSRPAHGVLVVCDEDDDCAAHWGPDAKRVVRTLVPGEAVMAVREFETWFLLSRRDEELERAGIRSAGRLRGAKEAMRKLVPGYAPTTHQLEQTRKLDIHRVWARSDSFDKLVRALASLFDRQTPARPSADPARRRSRR